MLLGEIWRHDGDTWELWPDKAQTVNGLEHLWRRKGTWRYRYGNSICSHLVLHGPRSLREVVAEIERRWPQGQAALPPSETTLPAELQADLDLVRALRAAEQDARLWYRRALWASATGAACAAASLFHLFWCP
jgi:hypothetical protein